MSINPYKKLGGQTLIYGLGTIIPRLLNYAILTYYYTRKLEIQEYGIITELYAYISIFLVILTYGMETGFFKFSIDKNSEKLFSSSVFTLFISSTVFIIVGLIFSEKIAGWMQYENFTEYIRWAVIIVSIDAFTNIFIAKLRIEERIQRFVIVQILNVIITIILVLFFLEKLPDLYESYSNNLIIKMLGNKSKVYYIFLANFLASFIRLVILLTDLRKIRFSFDFKLIKELLIYSLPLLIAQLSGTFNESLDRILLRHFLPENSNILYELGIYGANYRIAVLMTIFIQMFRYAADPFYFANFKKENAKIIYADVLKYFVLFCYIIFLVVALYIDFFKHFIDGKYHSGLFIVPIILFSSFLTGVLFNLNVWYKLIGKTYYGIIIIGSGTIVTVVMNILLIPVLGYFGCAITHLASTIIMVILSLIIGNKFYYIPYDLKKILFYTLITLTIFCVGYFFKLENFIFNSLKNTILLFSFVYYMIKKEKLHLIFIKGKDDS